MLRDAKRCQESRPRLGSPALAVGQILSFPLDLSDTLNISLSDLESPDQNQCEDLPKEPSLGQSLGQVIGCPSVKPCPVAKKRVHRTSMPTSIWQK